MTRFRITIICSNNYGGIQSSDQIIDCDEATLAEELKKAHKEAEKRTAEEEWPCCYHEAVACVLEE